MIRYNADGTFIIDPRGILSHEDILALLRIIPQALYAMAMIDPEGLDPDGIEALTLLHRAMLPTRAQLARAAFADAKPEEEESE